MKRFRTVLFWCHLVVGVGVAAIVLIMSVTGVLLTYERQMIDWADTRGLDAPPPTPEAPLLDAGDLLQRIAEADQRQGLDPASPSALTWRADADAPVAVAYGRDRTRFANPYTGAVLGEGDAGTRAFFDAVTGWHRWLGAGDDGRRVGRAITGACNLGFLFLVLSGFYLWWPRNWTRKVLRNVTWFRRGLSPKARDFNWHNVIGLWSVLPLVVIVGSGVVISYPWASDLVYAVVGEDGPAGPGQPGPPDPGMAPEVPDSTQAEATLAVFLARADARLPGWRRLTLQVPAEADSTVTLDLDRGTGGQPQHRAELVVDPRTGAEVAWEPFEAESAARRARVILRFAHTGEVLGVVGQTVAGLVSLGSALLVWTGLALSWRRFRAWRRRRRRLASA